MSERQENIGKRVKRLRKGKRMTQRALADALYKNVVSISNIECNITDLKTRDILALAELFGVTTDYLLKGE